MKHASITTGLIACSLSLLFSTTVLLAQHDGPAIDLDNPDLFPAEFFPSLSTVSETELLLAGLRSRYPERILTEVPAAEVPDPAPPVVRELAGGGTYIRVKHLAEALPVIQEHLSESLLLLDLRFLTTDFDSALDLGALLTRQEALNLAVAGSYPVDSAYLDGDTISVPSKEIRQADQTVFTLTNHETRGPLEAVLAQLKNDDDIISVGISSPGETADFQPFPGFDSYYLIRGEIRPSDKNSLVESGFVPRVQVEADPHADQVAYRSLRESVSLEDLVQTRVDKPRFDEARLLRGDLPGTPAQDDEEESDEPDLPRDTILQRALNIVKALQALGRING